MDKKTDKKKYLHIPHATKALDVERVITTLLNHNFNTIKELLSKRSTCDTQEKARIDERITSLVYEINSLEINGKKVSADELKLGTIETIDEFIQSSLYPNKVKEAIDCLLEGRYVPQFLFAGGATRFGFGIMWSVDLSAIADVLTGTSDRALSYISSPQLALLQKQIASLPPAEIKRAQDTIKNAYKTVVPVHIGMGARQLLQYRITLETLAATYHKKPSEILARAHLILNLNSSVYASAKKELVQNNFYGFNAQHVYILVQPTCQAYTIHNDTLMKDTKSEFLPFGHGHATMQMFYAHEAVTLDAQGNETKIESSVLQRLLNEGCDIIGVHRINDMTKWTEDVVNINNVAYAIHQIKDNNKEAIIELVENPNNQKGGNWLRVGDKEFLADTLSVSRPDINTFIHSLENLPYNAFRNMYSMRALAGKLSGLIGIKFNLRYKNGGFYLELVSGDITLLMNCVAFQKKGEIIHDIKQIQDYINEGIEFASNQEKDPHFRALALK